MKARIHTHTHTHSLIVLLISTGTQEQEVLGVELQEMLKQNKGTSWEGQRRGVAGDHNQTTPHRRFESLPLFSDSDQCVM